VRIKAVKLERWERVGLQRSLAFGFSALLMLLWLSSGIGGSFSTAAQQPPAAREVTIDNFSFGPMELTVPVGTQVTWINKDDVPHVVMSVDKKFKSKALDTDDKFSFAFQQAGTYEYFCSVHPKMTGKIVVK
jgi:plastocyanin